MDTYINLVSTFRTMRSKTTGHLLLVDDDEYVLLSGKMLLDQHFTNVSILENPEGIPALLKDNEFNVVVLDMNFSEGDTSGKEGLKWLKYILENQPTASVIMVTAYGDVNVAVEALKIGAIDFIVKPWQNEKLLSTVNASFNLNQEKNKVEKLKAQRDFLTSEKNEGIDLIGDSESMAEVVKMIKKVSYTSANLLIHGENGTGKEVVARTIHNSSDRKDQVFITVDLGAISESLFESELFGHKKGAFTDAKSDRIGKIVAADGGTLFLDEISNLPYSLQSKLLSVLQNRKVTPLGTNKEIDVDIRVICASNRDLYKMVDEGIFREDLLYRINTVEINLPPLRERGNDIVSLAEYFLNNYAAQYNRSPLSFSQGSISSLLNYKWPGNVRELEHVVERSVIMSEGNVIEESDLGLSSRKGIEIHSDSLNLDELENWAIQKSLAKHQGNVSYAAEELGLSRGALYRRMEKYGL